MKTKMMVLLLCFGLLLCGTVRGVELLNPSFEDPELGAGASTNTVVDWWDSASLYTKTIDDSGGTGSLPDTPYGDNWAQLGNGRWIYQQIGTYSENTTYNITFLLGQPTDKSIAGLHVELFAGGNPALAADLNAKRDAATFPLTATVGAVQIADSGDIDPLLTGKATQEMSVILSTGTVGTGYAVGDPLWLMFSRPSTGGKALIDNVIAAPPVTATLVKPSPSGVINIPITTDADGVDDANTTLVWDAPTAYTGATYNVYFGKDPNFNNPAPYGLPQLDNSGDTSATSIDPMPSGDLEYDTTYYWIVDAFEPNDPTPIFHAGMTWEFTTIPESPLIQTDPIAQLVDPAAEVTLTVDGLNFVDADVTWYHVPQGGTAAAVGSASKTLVIPAAGTSDEGQYYAVATNSGGTDTSGIAYVMTKRLVARYDFEGDLTDTQGSLNAAVIVDPNVADANSPSVSIGSGLGRVGSDALLLEDTDIAGYLEVPGSEGATAFHSLGMTVNVWIKTATSSPYLGTVVSGKNEVTSDSDFLMNRYYARARWKINALTVVDSPVPPDGPAMDDDQWHMLTGTYDPATQQRTLYIDGVQIGSLTGTVGDDFDSLSTLRIGGWGTTASGTTDRPFLGLIDDIRIYSFPRTMEQVAADYYEVTGISACYNPDFEGSYFDVAGAFDGEGQPIGDCQITLVDFVEFAKAWLNTGLYQP